MLSLTIHTYADLVFDPISSTGHLQPPNSPSAESVVLRSDLWKPAPQGGSRLRGGPITRLEPPAFQSHRLPRREKGLEVGFNHKWPMISSIRPLEGNLHENPSERAWRASRLVKTRGFGERGTPSRVTGGPKPSPIPDLYVSLPGGRPRGVPSKNTGDLRSFLSLTGPVSHTSQSSDARRGLRRPLGYSLLVSACGSEPLTCGV